MANASKQPTGKKTRIQISPATFEEAQVHVESKRRSKSHYCLSEARGPQKNRLTSLLLRLHYRFSIRVNGFRGGFHHETLFFGVADLPWFGLPSLRPIGNCSALVFACCSDRPTIGKD